MAARPEVVALSTDFDLQRTGFGQMWAASMMLNHLGEKQAATALVAAFEVALAAGVRTRDLGGTASAEEFTQAVLRHCGHVEDVSPDGRGTADWRAG
jgi:hypothetical protein